MTLTLISKPGCHLCDEARTVIAAVLDGLAETVRKQYTLTEQSILDDDALFDRYHEEIPVLLIDGKVHSYWRIDPDRLRDALTG